MEKNQKTLAEEPVMDQKELGEIKAVVREVITEYISSFGEGRATISDTDAFAEDLRMTSLDFYSCVAEIEEKYGLVILDTDAVKLTNIEEVAKHIYAMRHGLGSSAVAEVREPGDTSRITDFRESREYKELQARKEETVKGGVNPYFIPLDSVVRDTSVISRKDGRQPGVL